MYQSSFFMKRLWVWNWNGINCFKHNFLRAFCVKLTLLSTQPLAHVSVSDLGNINKISNLYNELDLLFQMTHLILLCLASISKKNNICNTLWLAVRNVPQADCKLWFISLKKADRRTMWKTMTNHVHQCQFFTFSRLLLHIESCRLTKVWHEIKKHKLQELCCAT